MRSCVGLLQVTKTIKEATFLKLLQIFVDSRLQNDLASITADHTQTSRCLEAARSEVEDLKLQVSPMSTYYDNTLEIQ